MPSILQTGPPPDGQRENPPSDDADNTSNSDNDGNEQRTTSNIPSTEERCRPGSTYSCHQCHRGTKRHAMTGQRHPDTGLTLADTGFITLSKPGPGIWVLYLVYFAHRCAAPCSITSTNCSKWTIKKPVLSSLSEEKGKLFKIYSMNIPSQDKSHLETKPKSDKACLGLKQRCAVP